MPASQAGRRPGGGPRSPPRSPCWRPALCCSSAGVMPGRDVVDMTADERRAIACCRGGWRSGYDGSIGRAVVPAPVGALVAGKLALRSVQRAWASGCVRPVNHRQSVLPGAGFPPLHRPAAFHVRPGQQRAGASTAEHHEQTALPIALPPDEPSVPPPPDSIAGSLPGGTRSPEHAPTSSSLMRSNGSALRQTRWMVAAGR